MVSLGFRRLASRLLRRPLPPTCAPSPSPSPPFTSAEDVRSIITYSIKEMKQIGIEMREQGKFEKLSGWLETCSTSQVQHREPVNMNEWCRDVILNESRRNLPLSPALISPVSPSTTASLAPVSPEPPVPASLGQLVRQVSLQMPPLKETETRKYAFPEIIPDLEMRIDLYQPGAHRNSFRSLVSLAISQSGCGKFEDDESITQLSQLRTILQMSNLAELDCRLETDPEFAKAASIEFDLLVHSVCQGGSAKGTRDVLACALGLTPLILHASLPSLTWLLCELLNRFHEDLSGKGSSYDASWLQILISGTSAAEMAITHRLKEPLEVGNRKLLQSTLDNWVAQMRRGLVEEEGRRIHLTSLLPVMLSCCDSPGLGKDSLGESSVFAQKRKEQAIMVAIANRNEAMRRTSIPT